VPDSHCDKLQLPTQPGCIRQRRITSWKPNNSTAVTCSFPKGEGRKFYIHELWPWVPAKFVSSAWSTLTSQLQINLIKSCSRYTSYGSIHTQLDEWPNTDMM